MVQKRRTIGRSKKAKPVEEESPGQPQSPSVYAESKLTPDVRDLSLLASHISVKDLPPVRKGCLLSSLVRTRPGVYSTIIGMIMMGASARSAFALFGLPINRVVAWGRQGAEDYANDVDSIYCRFYSDLLRASAHAVSNREMDISISDPLAWLERGPGKQFHNGALWGKATNGASSPTELPADNPLESIPERPVEDNAPVSTLTDEKLAEALSILDKEALVSSPAFADAAREQYRLPRVEPPGQDSPDGTIHAP